jgi:hypothetical protein
MIASTARHLDHRDNPACLAGLLHWLWGLGLAVSLPLHFQWKSGRGRFRSTDL